MPRWFKTLVNDEREKSLLSSVPVTPDNVVLRFSPNGNSGSHKFCVFNGVREMVKYYIPLKNKYHHEVVLGNMPQKMRYDIDHYDFATGQQVLEALITAIISVFGELGYKVTPQDNIIVATSHAEDKSKYSVHVIVDGYCVTSNHQAKELYRLTIAKIPELGLDGKITTIIDRAIYSKSQCFRLLLSAKSNLDKRVKRVSNYSYLGTNVPYTTRGEDMGADPVFQALTRTMITFTSGCVELLIDVPEEQVSCAIPDEESREIVETFLSMFPDFAYSRKTNSCIIMSRLRPTWCELCKHVHENMYYTISLHQDLGYVAYCGRTLDRTGYVLYTLLRPDECISFVPEGVEIPDPTPPPPRVQRKQVNTQSRDKVHKGLVIQPTALDLVMSRASRNMSRSMRGSNNRRIMMSRIF